jgi:Immunity protein 8
MSVPMHEKSIGVTAFLRARFEEPEAASWSELGEKLGRIGSWEFEDYREYKP